jgi:hypothetical protein
MREEDSRTHPIQEDMRFQYASWMAERVAWVLIALVPLLALSGVFARGALSENTVVDPAGSLSLTYERFQRATALSRLTARVTPVSDEVRLRLSSSFQHRFQIESVQPQPARSTGGRSGLELFFSRPPAGELNVVIWAQPRHFGIHELEAETDGSGPVKFSVVVYP